MELRGDDGDVVELRVVGYEFPDETGTDADRFDANWLNIRIRRRLSGVEASRVDPCLLTFEAPRLSAWLRATAFGEQSPLNRQSDTGADDFMEPTLGFAVVSRSGDRVTIDVRLDDAGLRQDDGAEHDGAVRLTVTAAQLVAAADSWDAELAAHPERPPFAEDVPQPVPRRLGLLTRALFLVHGIVTAAAGVVLIAAPTAIPAAVGILVADDAVLLPYLLGAAELGVAVISLGAVRLPDVLALRLIAAGFVVMHALTALTEVLILESTGTSRLLWGNVVLRVVVAALFAVVAVRPRTRRLDSPR